MHIVSKSIVHFDNSQQVLSLKFTENQVYAMFFFIYLSSMNLIYTLGYLVYYFPQIKDGNGIGCFFMVDEGPLTPHRQCHGPLTRYIKLLVAHAPGMPGKFSRHWLQRKPVVNDPAIPGVCATYKCTYLVRGPLLGDKFMGWMGSHWFCFGICCKFNGRVLYGDEWKPVF